MSSDAQGPAAARFEPLRPASRRRVILAIALGPFVWLVALLVAGLVLRYTSAIEIGLFVTAGTFLAALFVLALLRSEREHEERRYADRR